MHRAASDACRRTIRGNASVNASADLKSSGQHESATVLGQREWSIELRARFLGIGMIAVAAACLLFAVGRYVVQLRTGLATPWLFNAVGCVAIGLLYLWYRRAPGMRSEAAVHGTAAIATVLLLVPIAYAMPSTVWWLTLVGFAMTLMSRRREARLWAVSMIVLIALVPQFEPALRVARAAGEQPLEANMARIVFALILFGIAYAFRREIESRTSNLTTLTADLRAANAAKDRFIAHMSHELRTPLHGMLGTTEHMLHGQLSEQQKRQLESVRDSGATLLRLLNDVLEIGRAQANTLTLDQQPFDLHRSVAEVLPPFIAQAQLRGLQCQARAAPALRRARLGDAARIRQIVLNLISNALKFTPAGSIGIDLLPCAEHADGVIIRVSDSGIGMPEGFVECIGEPFVQGHTGPTRAHGGAGLGLAIVCELARRMQGSVRFSDLHAQDTAARGTVVEVSLRLALDPGDDRLGPVDLLSTLLDLNIADTSTAALQPRLHILVLEDDEFGRELIAATLTVLQHSFALANDGVEGLYLAATQDFDLVLSDIEMPNLDGYAFLQRFRAWESGLGRTPIPVMAVTAHAGPHDRARFLGLGFDDYLAKPFTIAELRGMLAGIEDLHRPARP